MREKAGQKYKKYPIITGDSGSREYKCGRLSYSSVLYGSCLEMDGALLINDTHYPN